MTELEKIEEYVRRKAMISNIGLSCKEYETEIKKILDELEL